MSDAAQGSRAGSRFGRYHLKRLLGRGGMGEVYEAEDTVKDRTVALKVMAAAYSQDPVFRERLHREARSAGRLHDPHVVPIHDYGEIDGQLYVDMRLIEGTDLQALLKRYGPLTPARAVAIIRQIASALDAAHAAGVMHRDVKPANILITKDDFAYLVDFGIANAATDEKLTKLGDVVGTYAYMSPERLTNDDVTNSADVYALACVLHECLTGSAPYRGSPANVMTAHLHAPLPRPSELRPGMPGTFDHVIARGMAKRAEHRYPTAGDLARAAHQALTTHDQDRAADILQRSQAATLPGQTTPATHLPPTQRAAPPHSPPPAPPPVWPTPRPYQDAAAFAGGPRYQTPPPGPGLGSAVAHTPSGGLWATPPPGAPPAPPWHQPPPAPAAGRGKWWLLAGAAVLAVLVVAGLVVWLWPKPPPPPSLTIRELDDGVFVGNPAAPTTIDIFDEPICPPCGKFITSSAADIDRAVNGDKIAVRYHLVSFLNNKSASGTYSTRAIAAGLCVAAAEEPKVYMAFYAAIFAPDFQPKEDASSDRTDDELAQLAESVGAPESVRTCIETRDKVNTAESKAADAEKSLSGLSSEGTTPAVFDGSRQVDIQKSNWVDSLG